MSNIEIKQITKPDEKMLDIITEWMYNWWGVEENDTVEEVKSYMYNSLQENRLPITYGIFVDNKIAGMYQFRYDDLIWRPDIYPWVANVYVAKEYRGMGLCRKMMETIEQNAKKNGLEELYIYTKHIGLYEKFGWKYVSNIDTFESTPRIQRLYKLDLR